MQKIPTLFKRDRQYIAYDEVNPTCKWVLGGEGVATVKWDGTACMILDGVLYRRHEISVNKPRPEGWRPAETQPDYLTGRWVGWSPVGDGPDDKWHRNGLRRAQQPITDGTYELCGPKIQGNPHQLNAIILIPHGRHVIEADPRTFRAIHDFLARDHTMEGIVWHHPDGRMAKIKKRDFGLRWPG